MPRPPRNRAGSRLQPAACCTGRDRLRFGAGERLTRAPCWSASRLAGP
jgi:hypothetical protein